MNLRLRTLILITATILLLAGLMYGTSVLLINNRGQAIEKQTAEQNISKASTAIQTELNRFTSIAGDWGTWDETYKFIQDLNTGYVTGNLSESAISVLDINQLVFVDANGLVKYSKGVDLVSKLDSPLPEDAKKAIESISEIWTFARGVASHSGILNLPEGELFFGSQPILKSDGTGPIMGAVITLRYIESTELTKLSGNSQLIINLTSAPANISESLLRNKEPGAIINLATAYTTTSIKSSIAIMDFTRANPVYLQLESSRFVYQTMSSVSYTILTVFLTLAALFIAVTWFLIQRATIRPVDALNQNVVKIGEEQDPSKRLTVKSKNEIGKLSSSINTVLDGLEKSQSAVRGRLNQLRTVAEISQTVTSVLDPQALSQQVVDLVKDRFNLYYVGAFLLDDKGEYALLRAGTGEAGKKMLESGHRLAVGGTSMIGWCTSNRKARIALDVGKEAVRFENPLLPLTRSELAIPIVSRYKVFGALTLQSDQVNAFSDEDIQIFQGIADSMAIALENARLFQESQNSLEEIRKLNQAYIQTSWQERLLPDQNLSYEYENRSKSAEGSGKIVNFPIRLRDQVLGNIAMETDEKGFQPEETELINAITDQIALALENVRLLEGTQARAAYERRLNTMTAEFSQKTNVEDILRSISKELSTIPFVSAVSIHLEPTTAKENIPSAPDKKGESNDDQIDF
jgi:sensor domain CHASE-containing protein/GAF domain-containing protein